MRTLVDKAGEGKSSMQWDRSPYSLNAVAVDLPWGGLLGSLRVKSVFGEGEGEGEMLVGVLIGRRVSPVNQSTSDD